MSMSLVRRAFQDSCGRTVLAARMVNEKTDEGARCRLQFDVQASDGGSETVSESFPVKTDLVSAARDMGLAYKATGG